MIKAFFNQHQIYLKDKVILLWNWQPKDFYPETWEHDLKFVY